MVAISETCSTFELWTTYLQGKQSSEGNQTFKQMVMWQTCIVIMELFFPGRTKWLHAMSLKETKEQKSRARGATLKVGGLTSDSKWWGGEGWKHLFLSNSLKFPKKWGSWNPPPLPLPLRGPWRGPLSKPLQFLGTLPSWGHN